MSTSVKINFTVGIVSYDFPLVQSCPDPMEGIKNVVHEGNRASGSVIIPGGKKSQEIIVKGVLVGEGYTAIQTLITDMKTKVTTEVGTLTKKYWNGSTWANTWSYSVRRISAIEFEDSLQTNDQNYTVTFLILSY